MKSRILLLLAAFSGFLGAAEPPPAPGKSVVPLFDGKSLSGWEGNDRLWRVQDGVITGGSLTETVKENDFLATTKDYGNFIVRLKIRLTGAGGFINSGFQIRSQRVPNNSEMAGYQCDYGEPAWYGCVYDESRRNKLMAQSDMKALGPVIKRDDWNDYVIRADGGRITTWINGVMGVDYVEADPKIVQTGKMGIQVHGGGKALVQVKDITLEELPPTPKREGAATPARPAKESPLAPDEEKAAFSLAPGLEVELVASEDIDAGFGKFVAVQFDQKGRLWTMTALEYPVDANENPAAAEALYASKAKDKVLVYDIEDRGTAGAAPRYAKKPTVFAEGLAISLGILPYRDGCYVQHGHDLALLRDTDGDGRADKREVVLTGFGVQDSHLFPHQFTRAPGGWLWLAQGAFNYSNVIGEKQPKPVKFDQTRMAKFRPDGSEFTITSNGPCNIWGLAMTGEGEVFIQEANDFGYPVMPFHEYANYPGCSNSQWKSYGPEFPSPAEFRMGGTGLSGLALTDKAGAFPAEWSDVMLVANPITNRIQAIKMHRAPTAGGGYVMELLPDVLVSGDPWFRPVALTLGPDGCVYIVDWYNKIISHNEVPRNHPERDKKRGRIWRLKGKGVPALPVPDLTKAPEPELVAKLGSASTAQSHLAWQTLCDRRQLAAETVAMLEKTLAGTNDAARIQALWVLEETGALEAVDDALLKSPNPNVRREALRASLIAAAAAQPDEDFSVRIVAITSMGEALAQLGEGPGVAEYMTKFIGYAKEALPEPVAPSTQSGKPIKQGVAYQREFERYLVRFFLEQNPAPTAKFLDSAAAAAVPVENRLVASLALPAKDSAPRVAKLLPQLKRAPNDEEILRLAEAPEDPAVKAALAALVASPDGLQALLRQKTRFDARSIAPLLAETAKALLQKDAALGLRVVSAFKLTALEPEVTALATADAKNLPAVLGTLRELGSTRSGLFVLFVHHADPAVRTTAVACLAATPDKLLPLWPNLNADQRRSSLDALTSTPAGSSALVAAVNDGRVAKDDLDGPLVEKLQAVLKDDAGLKKLLDSMSGLFANVLTLDGSDNAWIDANLKLEREFTVETWIKLEPGIGNQDGLLGAPGVLDINFFDSKLRVWVGGLNDVIVAKKPMTAGAWTHLAVTRDEKGAFKLYMNGELDQAEGKPDPRPYAGLAIGRTNAAGGTAAQFAEYRIWSSCRTPDEIRAEFDRTDIAREIGSKPVYYRALNEAWDHLKPGARLVKTMDFPALVTPEAAMALDKKFAHYREVAGKPGDATKGEAVAAVCMACHTIKGKGGLIGPNLSSVGAMGTEAILRNILTPNAAMEPGYRVYRAELTDGSIKEGFLAAQDENAIVIRLPGVEDQRIPADQVRRGTFTRRSLMPEGLEATFTPEQWADLFAYLRTLK